MIYINRANTATDGLVEFIQNGISRQFTPADLKEARYLALPDGTYSVEIRIEQSVFVGMNNELTINGTIQTGRTLAQCKDTVTKLFLKAVAGGGGGGTTDNTTQPNYPFKFGGAFENGSIYEDIAGGNTYISKFNGVDGHTVTRFGQNAVTVLMEGSDGAMHKHLEVRKLNNAGGFTDDFNFTVGQAETEIVLIKDSTGAVNKIILGDPAEVNTGMLIDILLQRITLNAQRYTFKNLPQYESIADAITAGLIPGMIYKSNFHVNGAPVLAIVE